MSSYDDFLKNTAKHWEDKGFKNVQMEKHPFAMTLVADFPEDTSTFKKLCICFEDRGFITKISFFDGEKWV
jgi:hypothetical protein